MRKYLPAWVAIFAVLTVGVAQQVRRPRTAKPTPAHVQINVPEFIAGGSTALRTDSISSGACALVVSATAGGAMMSDTLTVSFRGDPTGVAGYGVAGGGVLTIYPYIIPNAVQFKVCNLTAVDVTPGPLTLNWMVTR
jgi:hypothetical protein